MFDFLWLNTWPVLRSDLVGTTVTLSVSQLIFVTQLQMSVKHCQQTLFPTAAFTSLLVFPTAWTWKIVYSSISFSFILNNLSLFLLIWVSYFSHNLLLSLLRLFWHLKYSLAVFLQDSFTEIFPAVINKIDIMDHSPLWKANNCLGGQGMNTHQHADMLPLLASVLYQINPVHTLSHY